jgi:hypothetical protein
MDDSLSHPNSNNAVLGEDGEFDDHDRPFPQADLAYPD